MHTQKKFIEHGAVVREASSVTVCYSARMFVWLDMDIFRCGEYQGSGREAYTVVTFSFFSL